MKERLLRFGMLTLLVVFISGSLNMMGQTCPSGMISYWKLQEQAGPQFMDSFGPHDASAPSSSPFATKGVSGTGQLFNETSKTYVEIPDAAAFDWQSNTSFSIEIWVKFSGTTSRPRVFISRDGGPSQMQWWIGANGAGQISWYLKASDGSNREITTGATFNNDTWRHVVAVRNGTTGRNQIFVDGDLEAEEIVALTGNLYSADPIVLGSLLFGDTPDYFFTGAIDEVAIYNRVLDKVTDIQPHFTNAKNYEIGYCDGDDPFIFSIPNNEARVGQLYRYDVDASGNSAPTYLLLQGPNDMYIDAVTGLITWTPVSLSQNGHVVIRATNDKGFVEQEFNIFIADAPDCRNNLIAYWDFEETSVAPYSDNMANYQMTGPGPASVPTNRGGVSGKAVMFNGINDSLNVHDDVSPDKIFFDWDDIPSFSMEVWVKTNATPAKTMVVIGRDVTDNNSQYWLGITTDGTAAFYLRDWPVDFTSAYLEGGNDGETILDGDWHHLVGSYSETGRRARLYVDGNEVAVSNYVDFYNFGGHSNLTIGMLDVSPDRYWYEGIMDDVAFYNQQLSAPAVLKNYTDGLAGLGACTYNHAPGIVTLPDTTVQQDDSYYYKMVATDIDPNTDLSLTAVTYPNEWMTFTHTAGDTTAVLSGNPTNDHVGTHAVTLRVSDGSIEVYQDFTVRVINKNDKPVITSVPLEEIDQNSYYSYEVIATDADGDDLVYSASGLPASFDFDPDTHVLSGTPTNDEVPSVEMTVGVSDGTETTYQTITLVVNDINDAPEITSTAVTEIFQDEKYNYTVIAVDPDGDDLTYAGVQIPTWMEFDEVSHKLTGEPGDFIGIEDVSISVSDAEFTVLHDFQVEVKNVNDLPEVVTESVTKAYVGVPYLYQMDVVDADGDDLTFTAQTKPDWLEFIQATNSAILSGTPTVDNLGAAPVVIVISDGIGETIESFIISVFTAIGIGDNLNLVDKVYPIPARDVVYFNFSEVGDYTLVLYDINGKVLKQVMEDHTGQIKVDISGLNDQFILYKVSTEDNINVGKLITE
jgi:hypothetical protein